LDCEILYTAQSDLTQRGDEMSCGRRKIIVTVALCGETPRELTSYVPYAPEEIADSAVEAAEAGAAIAHIHVRDEEGHPTYESKVYAAVVERIKERSDIIINCTTGGSVYEERRKVLGIDPEMATLNCGSTNLGDQLMINSNPELEKMSREMLERGIKPEVMIHSQGFVHNAKLLMLKGLIRQPVFFNLFFASKAMDASARNLLYLVESLPAGSLWTATGRGQDAFPLAILSMLCGGHARIGLEDCVHVSEGKLARSNAELVGKLVRIARELDLDVASPREARAMLGIDESS
jgi:3-keto-5-aminohexanoate cleavage enzyme